ncbi:MAG: glycosyltransferase family 39 protein [Ardenticatenaceae bacterium]|nr:glycosyltransferase family 39 protein [Ardenticatenaceae bacterium]
MILNRQSSIVNRQSSLLLLLLLAFALRVWQLETTPPGWRDDELINSLVISQKVLDGDLAVYYADASGHEALYHALNAIMLGLFGRNFLGIRYLSVLLSLLTIALTYRIGRSLFNRRVGLIAATALTLSFWSLMYARIGLRHVLTPPLAMLAFYFFWKALTGSRGDSRFTIYDLRFTIYPITNYILSALFTALGLYTYFAARGVPLILLAYCGYLTIFVKGMLKRHWWQWLVWLGVTAVLTLPLLLTLQQQPESEARVAELALPVTEARTGNFQPLLQYTLTTLSMFHATGDSEWLYNIADRPLFGIFGAIVFWLGVLTAIRFTIYDLQGRSRSETTVTIYDSPLAPRPSPHLFLLLWWLAGISPAFISIPPASLSHTILAQPATFLLLALPFSRGAGEQGSRGGKLPLAPHFSPLTSRLSPLLPLLAILLLAAIALRDLPDYFQEWPERGLVRFLYRADFADIADYLNEHTELTDFGVTSLLAGPWDKIALEIDVTTAVRPRWYNPERVLLAQPPLSFYGFPEAHSDFADTYQATGEAHIGSYSLGRVQPLLSAEEPICFQNGLCALASAYHAGTLSLTWQVERPLTLPPIPLISNPPPPGVYAGPRLSVFAQLLSSDGQFLTGDDGLWIDPTTLYEGDIFIQQHTLPPPQNGQRMVFGLYDPMTNERILTVDGRNAVVVETGE